jgi:hypothetical protein
MPRLKAAIFGDLDKMMKAALRAAEQASYKALRDTGGALVEDMRGQWRATGYEKSLANSWRLRMYPNGPSLRGTAFVFTRAPMIMRGHNDGSMISAKGGGRYLAIPTGFNHKRGFRGMREMILTPQQMVGLKDWTFVRPFKSGASKGLLWFVRVAEAARKVKGVVRRQAYAAGVKLVGSGRVRRTENILNGIQMDGGGAAPERAVPMFLLLPQVKLRKVLDFMGAARKRQAELPSRLAEAWRSQKS